MGEMPDDEDAPNPSSAARRPYRDADSHVGAEAPLSRRTRARVLSALATISAAHGEHDRAAELSARASHASDDESRAARDAIDGLLRVGHGALRAHAFDQAIAAYRTLLEREDLPPGVVFEAHAALGTSLRAKGEWREGEAAMRAAMRSKTRAFSADAPLLVLHQVALLSSCLGRVRDASELAREVLARIGVRGRCDDVETVDAKQLLAECELDQRRLLPAGALVDEAIATIEAAGEVDSIRWTSLGLLRARIELAGGQKDLARQSLQLATATAPRRRATTVAEAMIGLRLAELSFDLKLSEAGTPIVRDLVRLLAPTVGKEHPALCPALRVWCRLRVASGQSALEGERWIATIEEGWGGAG